jgi:hypothetical protein
VPRRRDATVVGDDVDPYNAASPTLHTEQPRKRSGTTDATEANHIANRRSGLNVASVGEDYGQLPVGAYRRDRICTIMHIVCPTHGLSKLETLPYSPDNCVDDTGSYPEPVRRWLVCYRRQRLFLTAGKEVTRTETHRARVGYLWQ